MATGRAIGPAGTAIRVAAGAALLALAALGPWPVTWWGALLSLVVVPAVLVGAQALRTRGRRAGPVVWLAAAAVAGLGIFAAVGLMLLVGAAMLLGAARGTGGCEILALGNWVLGRRELLFCPFLSPIDRLEAALRERRPG